MKLDVFLTINPFSRAQIDVEQIWNKSVEYLGCFVHCDRDMTSSVDKRDVSPRS